MLSSQEMVAVPRTTHVGCIKCGDPVAKGSPFCPPHAAAPAGQRGGWLSAHRRRRVRGGALEGAPLDASCISRRLWVGARPPLDRDLPEFQTLVLCAQEIQPMRTDIAFRGRVIRCPLPDADLEPSQLRAALGTGRMVGQDLVAGKTVLVTCAMGWNRSALVACLGLGLVTRLSARELVDLVRAQRLPECLSNRHFVAVLERYIGTGKRAPLAALPP